MSRSIFEFLFKLCCDQAQVINMKVAPNNLMYLLETFQIFLRTLAIFPELFLFLCHWKRVNEYSKSISISYRAEPINPRYPSAAFHRARPDKPHSDRLLLVQYTSAATPGHVHPLVKPACAWHPGESPTRQKENRPIARQASSHSVPRLPPPPCQPLCLLHLERTQSWSPRRPPAFYPVGWPQWQFTEPPVRARLLKPLRLNPWLEPLPPLEFAPLHLPLPLVLMSIPTAAHQRFSSVNTSSLSLVSWIGGTHRRLCSVCSRPLKQVPHPPRGVVELISPSFGRLTR
jgi:hypothetical protein